LTFSTYIDAIRSNDLSAAKACWVIDDHNKGGALDVIVGFWLSSRALNQTFVRRFGVARIHEILKGWHREDVFDEALDLTRRRLEDCEVTITGSAAELRFRWKDGEGTAFSYGNDPVYFSRVDDAWKIDGNSMIGLDRSCDMFERGTWGAAIREQIDIMNEVTIYIENREKSEDALRELIDHRVDLLRTK
jgi:hypothetical protein